MYSVLPIYKKAVICHMTIIIGLAVLFLLIIAAITYACIIISDITQEEDLADDS